MAQNKVLNLQPFYLPGAAANLLNCGVVAPAPVQLAASTSASGGTLAAATYYYKVTALVTTSSGGTGETTPSNEQNVVTTGSTSSNTVTWGAVAGATGYRIYRGTAAGTENVYYQVGAVTTYLDINAASTGATPPTVNTAFFPSLPLSPTGLTLTQPYILVTHVRIVNDDVNAHTIKFFKGASGASVAGTEVFWPNGYSLGAGQYQDWYGKMRLDGADFLTGLADTGSKVTVNIDAEIGFS